MGPKRSQLGDPNPNVDSCLTLVSTKADLASSDPQLPNINAERLWKNLPQDQPTALQSRRTENSIVPEGFACWGPGHDADAIWESRLHKEFAEGTARSIAWYMRTAAPRSGFLSRVRRLRGARVSSTMHTVTLHAVAVSDRTGDMQTYWRGASPSYLVPPVPRTPSTYWPVPLVPST